MAGLMPVDGFALSGFVRAAKLPRVCASSGLLLPPGQVSSARQTGAEEVMPWRNAHPNDWLAAVTTGPLAVTEAHLRRGSYAPACRVGTDRQGGPAERVCGSL